MQSHFLSDAFFDSLRSVRFTDGSNIAKTIQKRGVIYVPSWLWQGKNENVAVLKSFYYS
ncbi:MAG: hypothetical protein LBR79_00585 [Oscillospiraceae bacterium]|jgi:hypothetical protein|nr:hypothetical protein [Oscillospiraceae bacterium]